MVAPGGQSSGCGFTERSRLPTSVEFVNKASMCVALLRCEVETSGNRMMKPAKVNGHLDKGRR